MKTSLALLAIVFFTMKSVTAQSWLLTGNAGTNASSNFLGTTDGKPLSFRVNDKAAGHIDFSPLKANTSFGFQVLKTVTGSNNTAFGYKASFANSTGNFNTSFGAYALYYTTSGHSNVAIGGGALYNNLTGSNLVAVGDSALYNVTSNVYNTAIGSKAYTQTPRAITTWGLGCSHYTRIIQARKTQRSDQMPFCRIPPVVTIAPLVTRHYISIKPGTITPQRVTRR
jgi:hypothetical protein